MKKLAIIILSALIVSLFFTVNLSAKQRGIRITAKSGESLYLYKDYHALVVGVSDYEKWPDLPNAVKDTEEVSRVLKRLGFTVKLVSNPTSAELKKVLNDMAYRYGREENRAILFYYAGHGETEALADGTKLGYIIPRDCPLLRDDPQGFVNRAISMKDIEAYSLRIRSKHVLMLFDSCFAGSLFSLVRAVPEDITEKSSLPVRQYITAGTEDETVPDKSMFKRCLL
ncbi:caspase family protein, partial [bacterium]|nr:caspase family protein [bacterium]